MSTPTTSELTPGLEAAARWVDQRRSKYDAEHGHTDPDTGTFEYGTGPHAQAREEYSAELAEIAEGIRGLKTTEKAPLGFEGLPLATSRLSIEERARWINVLDPMLRYAGRPGDWGRESKLGLLTQRLLQVRQELTQGEVKEGGAA
ncbi:hypothetical protein AVHY2522_23655 [Acidovorax sp. SUPP2522]|uniref:hypothetical protein n=1 Tax=unclassified Acidovorax TaxID=2684926 RepID=UPI00234B9F83|nr:MULTISPECIES: hypothetical protein [unclassified Acidovorax]WCM99942.1 hypothetical protein M5C96_11390 [Acidovorax sp. GBBC 1281]GKT19758.1 hypothetical protein AVHY2522_23655 [Acidovorax sp. SUPP2522]